MYPLYEKNRPTTVYPKLTPGYVTALSHRRHLLVQSKQWKHKNNVWNKLPTKTPERRHWRLFGLLNVNYLLFIYWFHILFCNSIVDFKQVNACWVRHAHQKFNLTRFRSLVSYYTISKQKTSCFQIFLGGTKTG